MRRRFRHIIFDLDGTLIDSAAGIAWSIDEALVAVGVSRPRRDLRPLLGPPIGAIFRQLLPGSDEGLIDAAERAFRASYDSEGWRRTCCFPGAGALLRVLSEGGFGLWVATNKRRLAVGKILRELGVDRYFEQVVCRDSRTPCYESKAQLLIDLLERNGLARAHCLMVGDTREDAGAARAAGVACAIVAHGYGGERAALEAEGSKRISNWIELVKHCQAPEPGGPETGFGAPAGEGELVIQR